eukprot:sb/3475897/
MYTIQLEVYWYRILDKSRICGSYMLYPDIPGTPIYRAKWLPTRIPVNRGPTVYQFLSFFKSNQRTRSKALQVLENRESSSQQFLLEGPEFIWSRAAPTERSLIASVTNWGVISISVIDFITC